MEKKYKERILAMVESINDLELLKRIYTFIKYLIP